MVINPLEVSVPRLHAYLLSAVAPRPIAFVSTIDRAGNANLAPFSFFNAFGSRPPTVVFSPARRVRDNTVKDTLDNVREVPEAVINVVTYQMVHQSNLASVEYPKGVDEFRKSGCTKLPSQLVRPFRVAESPVQMECRVVEIKPMGLEGGAANMIICEIVLMHISESVLDDQGRIDPHKLDLVARMGQDYYCRASGSAIFSVPKPNDRPALGLDQLPDSIRNSPVLTGNELARLANTEAIPSEQMLAEVDVSQQLEELHNRFAQDAEASMFRRHQMAKEFLAQDQWLHAWKILLSE